MPEDAKKPGGPVLDHNGCPIPGPLQVKEEGIRDARIAREKAAYEQGFDAGGKDLEDDGGMER